MVSGDGDHVAWTCRDQPGVRHSIRRTVGLCIAADPETHSSVELSELCSCRALDHRRAIDRRGQGKDDLVLVCPRCDLGGQPARIGDSDPNAPHAITTTVCLEEFDFDPWRSKRLIDRELCVRRHLLLQHL